MQGTEHFLSLLYWAEVYLQEVLEQGTVKVHLEPGRTCTLVSLCGFTVRPLGFVFRPPKVLSAFLLL